MQLRHLISNRTLAWAIATMAATTAHAQTSVIAQFDADVAKAVKAWNAAGLAVAVVRNDSLLFAKGYGVRELGKPEPVDADTRFAIGSTTKAMTVLALGMLVDETLWSAPGVNRPDYFAAVFGLAVDSANNRRR